MSDRMTVSDRPTTAPRTVAHPAAPATDGTSALAVPLVTNPPRRPLRVVPPREGAQAATEAVPPPPIQLLLRGLLEVLSGWRPAAQMALRVSPEIAADLLARPRRRSATATPQVLRLRAMRVSDSAVETCAVIRRGQRCGAVAMRLEFGSRGWLVTRLQIG